MHRMVDHVLITRPPLHQPMNDLSRCWLYLHSAGRANSHFGDGRLSFEPPAAGQAADSFIYDPGNESYLVIPVSGSRQ